MPRTVSSPGPKSHGFCGRRGFQETQVLEEIALALGVPAAKLLEEAPRKRARR